MQARWQRAAPYVVPALVFTGVILVMFWHLWTPFGERREFGIDSQWEYWGDLQFQLDAYRHGQLPLWNPWDRCGYPFHADPQAGIFYPLTWFLLAVGGVIRDVPFWLVDLKNLVHFWLAAVGMYTYLRWRGLPKFACYAAGCLTIVCSPWIHHLDLALNWSMAYAPWALLAAEACAARPTVGKGAALALVFGLAFLAGAPPTFWYLICAVFPVAVWAIVHHARLAPDRRVYFKRLALVIGLSGVLVVAMCVGQIAATVALLPNTVRNVHGLEFALNTQFNAGDLLGFLVPRVTRLNQYIGAVAVFAVAAAIVLRPTARNFVLLGLVVFGILCAFGGPGVLLRLLATAFAPFRYFRYAMRYTYVTMIAVPILVAEGLAALAEVRRGRWVILGVAAVGTVAMAVAAVVASGPARLPYLMGAGAYASAGIVLFGLVVSKRGIFMCLVPAFLFADNMIVHGDAIERNLAPHVDVSHDGKLESLAGLPLEDRIYDRAYLKFRPGLRRQIRDFAGYEDDPLALERYANLRDAIRSAPRKLGYANIRWLLEEGAKTLTKSPQDTAALHPFEKGIYEIPDVAPEVAWYPRADFANDANGALGALLRKPPGATAVLERSTVAAADVTRLSAGAAGPAVLGQLTVLESNHLVANVAAPADGVVVISEAFYPGWTATVDGAPATIVPANALFRGVLVAAGAHVIEMTYHAPLFVPLLAVELAALLLALGLAWRFR